METVLIEFIEGCGKPELVGSRMRMGAAQATNQIAKGRAILVDESEVLSEGEEPKRVRKRGGDDEATE